jgi:hypothetical protein
MLSQYSKKSFTFSLLRMFPTRVIQFDNFCRLLILVAFITRLQEFVTEVSKAPLAMCIWDVIFNDLTTL